MLTRPASVARITLMPSALKEKIGLAQLRKARESGEKIAMLTCYDYTTARLMEQAGVPAILVGDSASSVILGYPTTLPVSLSFMIEITAAVRRGAPNCFLVADMPFGSYQASVEQGVLNVCEMVKRTGCDAVKLETSPEQLPLIRALTGAGIAVIAHLGLRPQAVGVIGGYRYQGRTAEEAVDILALALQMQQHGATAILLEAVPPEVANAVVARTSVPVIGCGAGPGCHGCVIVTQDALNLSPARPKFVPDLADLASPMREAFANYVKQVTGSDYPLPQHNYPMGPGEHERLAARLKEI